MFEAITAFFILLSVGIFIAHAFDADLTVEDHSAVSLRGHRGIGRLFGNGICPVIGGSPVLADASAYDARLRIASAARSKADARSSALRR